MFKYTQNKYGANENISNTASVEVDVEFESEAELGNKTMTSNILSILLLSLLG